MAEHDKGTTGAPVHKHGEMDVTVQQKTFDAFIRFWVYLFGAVLGILVFLALFNS